MVRWCHADNGAEIRNRGVEKIGDANEEGGGFGGHVRVVGPEESFPKEVVLEAAVKGFDQERAGRGCEEGLGADQLSIEAGREGRRLSSPDIDPQRHGQEEIQFAKQSVVGYIKKEQHTDPEYPISPIAFNAASLPSPSLNSSLYSSSSIPHTSPLKLLNSTGSYLTSFTLNTEKKARTSRSTESGEARRSR